jgi:phage tail-like protein
MPDDLFARAFRFRVTLSNSPPKSPPPTTQGNTAAGGTLGDGAFAECSGLDLEMDVGEYVEGGRNNVLRRGMLYPAGGQVNTELWQWLQDVLDGVRPIRRYDGIVTVLDEGRQPVATWKFTRGLPAKLVGPQLNARTGEVAIEELQIAHEGLRMEVR